MAINAFAAAGAALLLALACARAAAAEDLASLNVQFADLDLSEPHGAQALFGRLKRAAARVCSAHKRGAADDERYEECVSLALSNAIARVDRPVLVSRGAPQKAATPSAPKR